MGSSTISLQDVVDGVAVMGDLSPQANPSGYGPKTCLLIGNNTMADLIARAFNWKWNSANKPPFLVAGYQQDYPQIGIKDIGWLEDGFTTDINSTSIPKPIGPLKAVDNLPVSNFNGWAGIRGDIARQVCWMYNKQLVYYPWAGPGIVYSPLITQTQGPNNPPMAFIDKNGNILTMTTIGTTGSTEPFAPANSLEGVTVADGTCTWTVCDPDGQGYRVYPNGAQNSSVWQLRVKAQLRAIRFTQLSQMIDPIPDDYSQHFFTGYKAHCYQYSADPNNRASWPQRRAEWIASMADATAQGNREQTSYGLVAASYPVDDENLGLRNPRNPGQPY